jgi:hypothetical protein
LNNQTVVLNSYEEIPPIPVVTDGLIIFMDSTNPASYPGTGTAWFNLVSGQPYQGTLQANVTYSNGYFQTVPTNGAIEITSSSFVTGPYTVMSATRYTAETNRGRMLAGDNNWLLGQWNGTTENYYAEGTIDLGAGPEDNNWRIYAGTGDQASDSYSLFVNGEIIISGSDGGAAGPDGLWAGAWGSGGGEASFEQNYNVLKSKVGL